MTFPLKTYQRTALDALRDFLTATRSRGVADAFAQSLSGQGRTEGTYQRLFADIPCVCLRVPTGGGKTIMGAHAVAIAGAAMLDTDTPVALWLTPSDTIRSQTLEALANVRHPYRQALAEHFGDRVRVCDLESLQTISPHDVGKAGGAAHGMVEAGGKIVLAVEIDAETRRIYQENFRPERMAADVCQISGEEIDCDILFVGLPCQAFSVAGQHEGLEDAKRSAAYRAVLRILRTARTKVVIIECARQFLTRTRMRSQGGAAGALLCPFNLWSSRCHHCLRSYKPPFMRSSSAAISLGCKARFG